MVFPGAGARLVGILHEAATAGRDQGVVIVVGGPQYRAGSHRHFVLLARSLAAAGYPVLRFDYQGMGDSDGQATDFEHIDGDIDAAVGLLLRHQPQLRRVVLWGLCDAASACLMHTPRDARVSALVLLNPWVRSEAGEARAYLRHYYIQRLLDREFWAKVARGRWGLRRSAGDLLRLVARLRAAKAAGAGGGNAARLHFTARMAYAWEEFAGPVLLVLSGRDLTADEFRDWLQADARRPAWLQRPDSRTHTIAAANHTFASRDWRDEVARVTLEWLASW